MNSPDFEPKKVLAHEAASAIKARFDRGKTLATIVTGENLSEIPEDLKKAVFDLMLNDPTEADMIVIEELIDTDPEKIERIGEHIKRKLFGDIAFRSEQTVSERDLESLMHRVDETRNLVLGYGRSGEETETIKNEIAGGDLTPEEAQNIRSYGYRRLEVSAELRPLATRRGDKLYVSLSGSEFNSSVIFFLNGNFDFHIEFLDPVTKRVYLRYGFDDKELPEMTKEESVVCDYLVAHAAWAILGSFRSV